MPAPLTQRVLGDLRRELDAGRWRPGTVMPGELQLCLRYGVCRRTVRRALAVLRSEGRIEPRRRRGTLVLPPEPRRLIAIMHGGEAPIGTLAASLHAAGRRLEAYDCTSAGWSQSQELGFLDALRHRRAEALLAFATPVAGGNRPGFARLARSGCRVIHLDPFTASLPAEEYVLPDYCGAGATAWHRLRAAGCSAVACLQLNHAPYADALREGCIAAAGTGYLHLAGPSLQVDAHDDGVAFAAWLARIPRGCGLLVSDDGLYGRVRDRLRRARAARLLHAVAVLCFDEEAPLPEAERLVVPRRQARALALATVLAGGPPLHRLLPVV